MTQLAQEMRDALNLAGDAVQRDAHGRVALVATECNACSKRVFPPTDVCPECMAEDLSNLTLGPRGTLYSWSLVHAAPRGWTLPFVAAYVDMPEGVRVFAHVVGVDPEKLKIDMPVEVCMAVLGKDETNAVVESYSFKPASEENN